MKHPEKYIRSYSNMSPLTTEILKDYTILPIIDTWCKYFLSLGVLLKKTDDKYLPFENRIFYKGNGFYDISILLDYDIENNTRILKQSDIPPHIQSMIEYVLYVDEKNFIDCDPIFTGEIYISFNLDEYQRNYIRKDMLNKLKERIKQKSMDL
ncbi:MAG: hypothetical protein ACOCVF_02655 [bacterium]